MSDSDTTKPTAKRRARASTANTATQPVPTIFAASKIASKSDTVVKLLLRAKGATPIELITATDWQPHSLRAFLSGLRKKGRVIVREDRKGGGFAYRIAVGAPEAEVPGKSKPTVATDSKPPVDDTAAQLADA